MPDDRPDSESTIAKRPVPKRPPNGLLAWEATVGYISANYSPDAMLKIQAYPASDGATLWSAQVSWGPHQEKALDQPSLADALRELWLEVERHHLIFQSPIEAIKRPQGYADTEWLDLDTQDILHRLVWTTQSVFPGDWMLIVVYRPVETPNMRVQARLLVQNNSHYAGGGGPSVHEACHAVYRGAARIFASGGQRPAE